MGTVDYKDSVQNPTFGKNLAGPTHVFLGWAQLLQTCFIVQLFSKFGIFFFGYLKMATAAESE